MALTGGSAASAALGDDVGRRDQHPTGWHDDTHPRWTEFGYLNSVRALRFGSLRSDDDCSRVAELLAELSSELSYWSRDIVGDEFPNEFNVVAESGFWLFDFYVD
jgi:hypothetical protein